MILVARGTTHPASWAVAKAGLEAAGFDVSWEKVVTTITQADLDAATGLIVFYDVDTTVMDNFADLVNANGPDLPLLTLSRANSWVTALKIATGGSQAPTSTQVYVNPAGASVGMSAGWKTLLSSSGTIQHVNAGIAAGVQRFASTSTAATDFTHGLVPAGGTLVGGGAARHPIGVCTWFSDTDAPKIEPLAQEMLGQVAVAVFGDPGEPPADSTAPTVPVLAQPTLVGDGGASLSWSASTDAVGPVTYRVMRNGAVVVGSTTATTRTESGLAAGSYTWTVSAADGAGNRSAESAPQTLVVPDTSPPTVPVLDPPSLVAPDGARLVWSTSTDASGVASYRLRRGGVTVTGAEALTVREFTESGLVPGSYSWTVSAVDTAGNRSAESAPQTLVVPNPTTPTAPVLFLHGSSGRRPNHDAAIADAEAVVGSVTVKSVTDVTAAEIAAARGVIIGRSTPSAEVHAHPSLNRADGPPVPCLSMEPALWGQLRIGTSNGAINSSTNIFITPDGATLFGLPAGWTRTLSTGGQTTFVSGVPAAARTYSSTFSGHTDYYHFAVPKGGALLGGTPAQATVGYCFWPADDHLAKRTAVTTQTFQRMLGAMIPGGGGGGGGAAPAPTVAITGGSRAVGPWQRITVAATSNQTSVAWSVPTGSPMRLVSSSALQAVYEAPATMAGAVSTVRATATNTDGVTATASITVTTRPAGLGLWGPTGLVPQKLIIPADVTWPVVEVPNQANTPAPVGWQDFTPLDVSAGGAFVLRNDTDYLIAAQTAAAPVRLRGGRKVVVMGLTVNVTEASWTILSESSSTGISTEENPYVSTDERSGGVPQAGRIFHLEGVRVTGPQATQGARINCATADVAVVNMHVDLVRFADCDHRDGTNGKVTNHPDIIQTFNGAFRTMRVDGLTGYSMYQGLFFRAESGGNVTTMPITLRRVDIHMTEVTGTDGVAYAGHRGLWNYGGTGGLFPITIEDDSVYVDGHPNNGWAGSTFRRVRYYDTGTSSYVLEAPLGTATDLDALCEGGNTRAVPGTDGQGAYATLSSVSGKIRLGSPAQEWVPAASVGAGYVPPSTTPATFLLEQTKPTEANTGIRQATIGQIDGDFTPQSNQTYSRVRFAGRVLSTASMVGVKFVDCEFVGLGARTSDSALVNMELATSEVRFEHCTFDPTTPSAYWHSIRGKNYTAYRCLFRRVVDGPNVNVAGTVNVKVHGCYVSKLGFFVAPYQNDKITHNDGGFIFGGTNIEFLGNTFEMVVATDVGDTTSPYAPSVTGQGIGCSPSGLVNSPPSYVTIRGNWFSYGAKGITVVPGVVGIGSNWSITGNRFDSRTFVLIGGARRCIVIDPSLTIAGMPATTGPDTVSGNVDWDGSPAVVHRIAG